MDASSITVRHAPLLTLALLAAAPDGCAGGATADTSPPTPARPDPMPAGANCQRLLDCPRDQHCVAGRCRYASSSVAGEVLASAARALAEQGDERAAATLYADAVEAFAQARRPVPPEVLCEAAAAALRAARTTDERERAASRADDCFRNSLPGAPERGAVHTALARLRYEGLDLTHYDEPEPAGRFFTKEAARPTLDAVEVAIELPDVDVPGFEHVAKAFRTPEATRAVAGCFVENWERSHARRARGALLVQLQSKLRDMGYYDTYEALVRVRPGRGEQAPPFETCAAKALESLLSDRIKRRIGRVVSWKQPVEIAARLQ